MCILLGPCVNGQAQMWEKMKSYFSGEENPESAKIKILIHSFLDGALLDIKGAYDIYNPMNGDRLASRFFKKNKFIQPCSGGLRWGEEFPGVYQLAFIPDNPSTTILVNGIEYRGAIYIYQIGNDKLSVVNEVDIEDFVKSVLSVQFDKAYSPETMAAMAIIARTDAYYQRTKNLGKFWHFTIREVDYQGYAVTHNRNGVDKAVDATRFLIMNDLVSGSVFPAKWTEHSAGRTADFSSIFRIEASAPRGGIKVPYAAWDREEAGWTYKCATSELAEAASLNKISELQVFKDSESNRVYAIRFQDGSEFKDISFLKLQESIGRDKVRSNDFSVSLDGNNVVFSGYGKGHGVGLCLYSAELMAEKGKKASEILKTFFPGVFLEWAPKELPSSNDVVVEEQGELTLR